MEEIIKELKEGADGDFLPAPPVFHYPKCGAEAGEIVGIVLAMV